MNQRRYKLTTIGPIVISAILVFVFVILYVVSSRVGAANIQEGLDAVSLPVMTTTAKLLFNPLYNLDLTKMTSTLDPYVDGTNVVYAAVYDVNGQLVVGINKKWGPDITLSQRLVAQAISEQDIVKNQQKSYLILTKPITAGTTAIGAVEIVFDIAPLQAALGRSETIISITLFLALIATTFTFYFVFRYVFRPLNRLAQVAQEISQGNTTVRIPLEGSQEVHNLAVTLAELIEAERASVATLELRVADRTRDLETVAEVGTATATILDSKRLLQEVVDLTKERFNLYHSHIYLLDEESTNLVLTAGAGEPGRIMVAEGHSIPLDREQSLVARAARERKGVTVNDVTQAADFLPNPLLPDTHSELAVPMIVRGNVIGVFDIQSEKVGRFTESDVNIQTTLAAQLGTSIQNVRTYEQSRRQAELESLANAIGQKIQRTTSIEETLQIASRELGTAIGASRGKSPDWRTEWQQLNDQPPCMKGTVIMDNRLSSNVDAQAPQADSINRKRTFWASVIFTFVAITSFIFAIFLVGRMPAWQTYTILALTAIALVIDVIATVLILRGRMTAGLLLLYWSLLFTVSLNALLVTNTTQYLIAIILLVGFTHVFYLQPRSWRKSYIFGPIIVAALMAMVEIYNPSFRMNVTNTTTTSSYFGPIIFSFLVVSLISLVVWQAWGGSIRLKLVTSFTVIALISVTILGTVTYISYRNQLHEDIRQRLLNIASITATQQDGDLHASIQGPDSMEKEAYQKMAAQGLDIIRTDPGILYLYTMRMNEQGQIYFIIDAEQGDYKAVDVGTVYDGPSDLLLENFNTLDRPIVEEDIYTDEYGSVLSAYAPIYRADGTREAIVGVDISAEKIIAQEKAVFNLILGATLVTLIFVTLIGLFLGNLFTQPIINLSLVAEKVAGGDLGARARIETTDEIGDLARTFNAMTSQLQNTLQGLEQRVSERTHNLELAAEVGRAVSQVRDLDGMLRDACELILKEFDLYYVQVYLTDPGQTVLKLEAGTGNLGAQLVERGHSLPLNSGSINGRAAFEKRSVVISDTIQSATFRQNPMLPDTRGEMAVPLIVGNQVVGVLDMQSSGPGVLNNEILPAFEALAGQLAIAIRNATLLAEAEQARLQVEAQARRLVRTGWNEHLDAIHKPEQIGFIYGRNQVVPMTITDEAESETAISVPIVVSGEPLGSLVVEINDEARRAQTDELVNIVAHQVAQQIENLRLLEDAERYRYEAEQATRLQTVEGWQRLIESRTGASLGYLYDSKEVRPHDHGHDEKTFTFSLPIKVHDEMIGTLAVQGLESKDQESVELIDAVAERLSAHIENLRLFEQTQVSLAEAQSLYRINEAIGSEMDLDTIYQAVAKLSCDEMGFSGSWISVYEPEHEILRGVAGVNIPEEMIFDRLPLNQNTPANFAAQTRQTVTINHPEKDARMLGIPQNVREGMGKALSTPVMIGQELFGVIAVTRPVNAPDIGAREERMLQIVATQLAIVMQRVKFFDQVQKQAKRESMLNIISQKIQGATTVEAVLQIAARELGHALGAPMTIAQLSMKEKAS